jgi:mRNA interferase MazF
MNRGEIYWCDLNPRRGHEQGEKRPVIVVSVDAYNESRSALVGVVPMTTEPMKNPIHVALSKAETGLTSNSTALIDHARFLDRTRLGGKVAGRLTAAAQQRVDLNLKRVLGL